MADITIHEDPSPTAPHETSPISKGTRLLFTTWKPGLYAAWVASDGAKPGIFSLTGGMDGNNPSTVNLLLNPAGFLSTTAGQNNRLSIYFEAPVPPRTRDVLVLDYRQSDLTDPIGLRVGRFF